jgi:hypothetical protein
MSVSSVSSSHAAAATQAAQNQAAQKAQAAAQQKQDSVQLSDTAKKALQGGDSDGDHDGK